MYAGPDLSQKSHLRGVQVLHMDMEKVMEDPGCLQLPSTLDVPGPSFTSAQPHLIIGRWPAGVGGEINQGTGTHRLR